MTERRVDVVIPVGIRGDGPAGLINQLAVDYAVVARVNGGPNAGGLVYPPNGGEGVVVRHLPSAALHQHVQLYIGPGCAVNPVILMQEIRAIESAGGSLEGRLHISDRALVLCPDHVWIDMYMGRNMGTTRQGIGIAYQGRVLRAEGPDYLLLRVGDFRENTDMFLHRTEDNLKQLYEETRGEITVPEGTMADFRAAAIDMFRYVTTERHFLNDAAASGKRVLLEGAFPFELDNIDGYPPFVEPYSVGAAAALVGGSVAPAHLGKVFGVCAPFMTRSDPGPMMGEFGGAGALAYCLYGPHDEGWKTPAREVEAERDPSALWASEHESRHGMAIRILTKRYGRVTGRPGRIGPLDLRFLHHAAKANSFDGLYVVHGDLLHHLAGRPLPAIEGYTRAQPAGRRTRQIPTKDFPKSYSDLLLFDVKTTQLPCSPVDVSGMTAWSNLPEEFEELARLIGENAGCRVAGVSVGLRPGQLIRRPNPS